MGMFFEVCETRVSITSIDLACEELGRRVARLALKCIGEKSDSSLRSAMFSPRVVQRMSTRTI